MLLVFVQKISLQLVNNHSLFELSPDETHQTTHQLTSLNFGVGRFLQLWFVFGLNWKTLVKSLVHIKMCEVLKSTFISTDVLLDSQNCPDTGDRGPLPNWPRPILFTLHSIDCNGGYKDMHLECHRGPTWTTCWHPPSYRGKQRGTSWDQPPTSSGRLCGPIFLLVTFLLVSPLIKEDSTQQQFTGFSVQPFLASTQPSFAPLAQATSAFHSQSFVKMWPPFW